jgi:hypothetical protein
MDSALVWVMVFFCANPGLCDPNSNTLGKTYETEDACQRAGLKTLWDAPKGMQGKVVVCIKGVR